MRTSDLLMRLCFTALLALHSTGCQSGSTVAQDSSRASTDYVTHADALLAEPPRTGNAQQQRLLAAAMLYVNGQAYAKASDTLNRIDTSQLIRTQRGDFLVTSVDAALGSGDVSAAWASIARPPAGIHEFIDDLQPTDYARIAERRGMVLERRGQLVEAVRERISAAANLPADLRRNNSEAIWSVLLRIDRAGLRQMDAAADAQLRGWTTLAAAWRDSADSASLRTGRINAWLQANPDHPAAVNLPAAVQKARTETGLQKSGSDRIAVLLPQHGKLAAAGIALQRGLLVAWFNARENGVQMPSLSFYDSSRSDFNATYDLAVADGAQLIIGPLEKENLRLLQQRKSLPVITLALNYPESEEAPNELYFFGLSGEDEASQIAAQLTREGLRRAAILFPAADWGQRVAQQFEQTLNAQGGQVQAKASYQGSGDYSDVVRRLMDVSTSEQRHSRLERLLGTALAFQPRRRQDIDSLVMIANTAQATQLAPAVQYHYGADIPVFATSNINNQADTNAARDLEGIRFVEIPWIFDSELPLRLLTEQTWRDIDERYVRLYGLGIDALRISQQLATLSTDKNASLDGTTGMLTMDVQRRVHRELSWMIFRDGRMDRVDAAN